MIMPALNPGRVTLSQFAIYSERAARERAEDRLHAAIAARVAAVGGWSLREYIDELLDASGAREAAPPAAGVTAEQITRGMEMSNYDYHDIEWQE